MKQITLFLTLLLMACNTNHFNNKMDIPYPKTRTTEQTDTLFGIEVKDPYRWLEDDNSKETMAWVDAQNETTEAYLAKIPFRNQIRNRMETLWNYPKVLDPFKKGNRYFEYRNNGLQNQSVLYVQSNPNEEASVLIDPNTLSEDGTVALSQVEVSTDGKYLAYAIARAGSDWTEVFIRDIDTKEDLSDHLLWIKSSELSWDANGFYYSRFPQPKEGDELKGENSNSKVYYHTLGTPQDSDVLIFETPEHPEWSYSPKVIGNGEYLTIYVYESTSGNALFLKNLHKKNAPWVYLVQQFDKDYSVIGMQNNNLLVLTNNEAPKYKVQSIPLANPTTENWVNIIPEKEHTIVGCTLINDKLITDCLKDAQSLVEIYTTDGKYLYNVDLPGIGSVSGFTGENNDKTTYFTFTSFTTPGTIFEYDLENNTSTQIHQSEIDFNPNEYETKQVFYSSKDGTKIPMFITHKKGLQYDDQRPTLLYSYGGFNISLPPTFSIALITWLENDGIIAVPNIRGGGEHGEAWHKAGTLMQKQNVFDDFIAAAEYLIKNHYTSSEKLTIQGGSNGGLLVGAVTNQRPELFKVALPAVGVMDMLRYHKFTIGRYWATDYGTSDDSKEMFEYLLAYSPVHNVKAQTNYPAIMVTTADHDDRVVPAHSFKYAAELQAKKFNDLPRLIRIDKNAGHGAGKPTSKIIDYYADLWAFSFFNMQITPKY